MAIHVNMEGILAKIKSGPAAKSIERQVAPILKKEFDSKKKEIIQYFDNHRVTQELEAGPTADGSIVTTEKGGNLFSFLGFYDGEDPVGVLREELNRGIYASDTLMGKTTKKNTLLVSLRVQTPTVPEISEAASQEVQLEWTDRDWVQTIEKGSSGFGQYLFKLVNKFKNSRSGTALQTKNSTLRNGSFRGVRYISDVLKKARQILRGGE